MTFGSMMLIPSLVPASPHNSNPTGSSNSSNAVWVKIPESQLAGLLAAQQQQRHTASTTIGKGNSPTSATEDNTTTSSECSSSTIHSMNHNINTTATTGSSSMVGRNLYWGWYEGILLAQDERAISVQVVLGSMEGGGGGESSTILLTLPPTAFEENTIVHANENHHHHYNHHHNSDGYYHGTISTTPTTTSSSSLLLPPHDLITLTHLHEPAVVAALQIRYHQHQIYTNTGKVLLALNPFQSVHHLYGESVQKQYAEGRQHLPPHVYSIADHAYRDMMRSWEDSRASSSLAPSAGPLPRHQSILVSGESGSGKTVTTKFVMKYLAGLSVRHQQPTPRAHDMVGFHRPNKTHSKDAVNAMAASVAESRHTNNNSNNKSIEAQVLQSNPILESFGNARTVRNDNSSRFGKFIEIRFAPNGVLVGAVLETYLLEKVRLVSVMDQERNYHIFYQLLSDEGLCRTFGLHHQRFKLLGQCHTRRDGVSDRETFAQTMMAFDCMEFTKSDVKQILQIVAGLLHASNLTFQPSTTNKDGSEECCELYENIDPVCQYLEVDAATLQQALCYQLLQVQDTIVERSRNVQQAAAGLEALIKETYGALFDYIVKRINRQMNQHHNSHHNEEEDDFCSIGVLDIFGFESFAVNSFEQLCINYCNEALQQQFNAYVLKNEQAEYEREGIQWSFIEFPENQNVLDLIEKRGSSLLSILDDQCRAPGPSDKAYGLAVYHQCRQMERFSASRKQQALLQFSVHHYAGPVEYTVTGFTQKNKDELPKETMLLLRSSSLPLLEELAIAMEDSLMQQQQQQTSGTTKLTPTKRADSSVGRATVGGQFRKQLRSLRQKIDQTSPHYVRCLKPNDLLVPDHFDTGIVAEQLRCGGILEAVRVARAGFTQHYSHADFVRRYKTLAWKELSTPILQPPLLPLKQVVPPKGINHNGGRNFRNSYPAYIPKTVDVYKPKGGGGPVEMSPAEAKTQCNDLIRILYKKIRKFGVVPETPKGQKAITPVAKAKSYSYKKSLPSWSKQSQPQQSSSSSDSPSQRSLSPNGRAVASPAAMDYIKLGIQMGKTKVFLRHKAFEALERIRSAEQTKAATLLNSMFRRYLARIAYLPYRTAMRRRARMAVQEEFKESKEAEEENEDYDYGDSFMVNKSFQSIRSFHSNAGGCGSVSLDWDHWTVIREAIHNPVPRHEWGKQEVDAEKFKWVIRDGLWKKNYATNNTSNNNNNELNQSA